MASVAGEDRITAKIALSVLGERLDARVTVPAGNTSCSRLLPVFRALADAIVSVGVEQRAREGKKVSCVRGCVACCYQLVPVSGTEARALHALVGSLPEPRRGQVEERFREARRRLDASGLVQRLLSPAPLVSGEAEAISLEYLRHWIACPFLENGSCSIYEDRPIACREYLVTSDPLECSRPSAETVERVPIASRVSTALSRLDHVPKAPSESGRAWIPLLAAPEWALENPIELSRSGPDLLRGLIELLTGDG